MHVLAPSRDAGDACEADAEETAQSTGNPAELRVLAKLVHHLLTCNQNNLHLHGSALFSNDRLCPLFAKGAVDPLRFVA